MRSFLIAPLLFAAIPAHAADGAQAPVENSATEAKEAATTLPEPVRKMIESAARSGDQARADAVAAVARETHPESVSEIDNLLASITAEQQAQEEHILRQASFFDNWSGSGEVGGSIATGNSDTKTVAVGLKLNRDGLNWRHRVNALADIQRSEGESTQERLGINYQADWKITERFYTLARIGWERNRVSGLRSRFTEMLGVGYHVIDLPHLQWEVEGGPALSQARYEDYRENQLAGRFATSFLWEFSPGTTFTQEASVLTQSDNSSFLSVSALSSKLFGAFSARASFTVQHETSPPDLRKNTDTVTRLTLVYDF